MQPQPIISPSQLAGNWVVGTPDPVAEAKLQQELNLPRLVARILVQRGFGEPAAAYKFLNPSFDDFHSPDLLPDYAEAVAAILHARDTNGLIYIHGDYDVDGVSSSAILHRFLTAIGCRVHTQIPHRMNDGYGLNLSAVKEAHQLGASLMLTCDCGIGAIEEVDLANSLGLRVVITDHHEVGPVLPNAVAVVNPHRRDNKYPFDGLSGAGVAFKLCEGLCNELRLKVDEYYRRYLDLAVLGTIADVMPLVDENRLIAKFGLEFLRFSRKKGIQSLMRVAGIRDHEPLKAGKISFQIGPRLNAAGRIDDADIAFRLLITTSDQEAVKLARQTDDLNLQRRGEQERMTAAAIQRVIDEGQNEKNVIFVVDPTWHTGIVGIVAGKLVDKFHRPSFVGTADEQGYGKASARSIPGLNIADAIRALPHLMSGGGHSAAAGCSFDLKNVSAIHDALDAYAAVHLNSSDYLPTVKIDAELDAGDVSLRTLDSLCQVEPFGSGNPEPTFLTRNVRLAEVKPFAKPYQARLVFQGCDGAVQEGVTWSAGEEFAAMPPGTQLDVVYKAEINEYNGVRSARWKVDHFRPSETPG